MRGKSRRFRVVGSMMGVDFSAISKEILRNAIEAVGLLRVGD